MNLQFIVGYRDYGAEKLTIRRQISNGNKMSA